MESQLPTCGRSLEVGGRDGACTDRRRSPLENLTPRVSPSHLHTVSVTLADTAIDHAEMMATLRQRLAPLRLLVAHDRRGRTVLVLTVESGDLWLAILQAMSSITATGYLPVAVEAHVADVERFDGRGPGSARPP